MKTEIKNKLTESGIKAEGINSNIVKIIEEAIDTVNTFGFDYWLNITSSGIKIKNIVKSLSN